MTKLWVSFLSVKPLKAIHRTKGAFVWGVVFAESGESATSKFHSALKAEGFAVINEETEPLKAKIRREKQNGYELSKIIAHLAHRAVRSREVQLDDYFMWEQE